MRQAQKIVAAYRAEAPEGFDVVCQAYGQTDVMHDRRYLLANMANRGPHDPIRLNMEAALRSLNEEEATAEKSRQFGIQQAGLEESRQQRAEAGKQSRESLDLYRQGLTESRQERMGIAQEAQNARMAAGLQMAMSDPNLSKEERAAAKTRYLAMLNVQVAPNAAGVQKGAYGPGGPPATPDTADPRNYTQYPGGETYTGPNRRQVAASIAGAPGGPQYPAVSASGGPAPSTAGAQGYTKAFTDQVPGGRPTVSSQDLSPGPGASPARAERAAILQGMVDRGEATTGERPAPLITPNSLTGPATYDPNLGANVAPNVLGQNITVGAGDPSVNALGMPVRDYAKLHGAREAGKGEVGFNLPGGGYFKGTLPAAARDIPASRPSFTGKAETAQNVAPKEAGLYPGAPSFIPPTAAFTTGGSAAQPGAQPANLPPPGPINEPAKIQIGLAGQKPVDIASIAYTGGMSNQAQEAAALKANPQGPYGPGSNQALDAAAQAALAKLPPPMVPPPKKTPTS